MKSLRKAICLSTITLLLLACLAWLADGAWHRWGVTDGERICMIAGETVPQAEVLRTLYDDGYWAVFFNMPEAEAEALWQRVAARNQRKPGSLAPEFTFGIGNEEWDGFTGSLILLPSAGDGSCRYLLRLADGNTFVAVKACYGI